MLKNLLKTHGLFIALVVLVLLAALPILSYPMGRDQGMYANIGRVILAGGTPYVDMWDQKPPPIYYLYAFGIGLFGATTQAVRALDLLFVPLGLLGLYLLGERLSSKALGLIAALLFGVFYFNDGFQNLSQSDSLATIPTIWMAYCAVRARQAAPMSGRAMLFAAIAGALSGLLLWFKPQYAFVVLVFLVVHLYSRIAKKPSSEGESLSRSPTIKTILFEGLAFALGGLLVAGGLLAYFASKGILQEILTVGQVTAAYNAQGYDVSAFLANMGNGFYYRWLVWHSLIILVGLWFVLRLIPSKRSPSQPAQNPLEMAQTEGEGQLARDSYSAQFITKDNFFLISELSKSDSAFILLWLFAGFAFAFIQAKGFDTHWFPLLAPMAFLGAAALIQVIEFFSRNIKKKLIAFYGISVIVLLSILVISSWGIAWRYLTKQENLAHYWDRFQANDLKPEQSMLVAKYLRDRVPAGGSLYIWGFRPEVYYMAGLWPATRYQAQFPLVAPWYPQEWKQNNVDILWAAMPPYVLVLEDDYMAWVTNSEADSHTLLQSYTELNNWLIANYERDEQIGDFLIWRRKS